MLDRLFDAGDECLDSAGAETRPRCVGAQSIGKSYGDWNAKILMITASSRPAMIFGLSGGPTHAALEGGALPERQDESVAKAPSATRSVDSSAT